ncbi:hypothetical protein G6F57_010193 [Rhizopus arrhizus]|uniref:Uncharacterized protein n=1 Tax=Rhizopus oryzae TaxID=64495 RepID=A0A9P6X221_RHIOR|nr:hypothetical protein G6F23_005032 [Rhizopus arrhizus]KAG1413990.1 hypothetical protein G6F58_007185 [Rhizopus delemar]KAG0758107.1 hypothetical protein G6F24_010038 [Rhizopus arrhizus]KAG0784204.1 hypothetical protein G6F21_010055 [Rhizopus arrhizus]KAG0807349.1 hypothetical protein G6F20_010435 [Rhizopus arrhizus]
MSEPPVPSEKNTMDNSATMSKSKKKRLKRKSKKALSDSVAAQENPISPEIGSVSLTEEGKTVTSKELPSEAPLSTHEKPLPSISGDEDQLEKAMPPVKNLDQRTNIVVPPQRATDQETSKVSTQEELDQKNTIKPPSKYKQQESASAILPGKDVDQTRSTMVPPPENFDQETKDGTEPQSATVVREAAPLSGKNVEELESGISAASAGKEKNDSVSKSTSTAATTQPQPPTPIVSIPSRIKDSDRPLIQESSFTASSLPAAPIQPKEVSQQPIKQKNICAKQSLSTDNDDYIQSVIDSKFIDIDSVIKQVKSDVEGGLYDEPRKSVTDEAKLPAADRGPSAIVTDNTQSDGKKSDFVQYGIQSVINSSVIDTDSLLRSPPVVAAQSTAPALVKSNKEPAIEGTPEQQTISNEPLSPSAVNNRSQPLTTSKNASHQMPSNNTSQQIPSSDNSSQPFESTTSIPRTTKSSKGKSFLTNAKKKICIIL